MAAYRASATGNGNGHGARVSINGNGHGSGDDLRQGGVRIVDEDVHVVIRTSEEIEREAVLAAAASARARPE